MNIVFSILSFAFSLNVAIITKNFCIVVDFNFFGDFLYFLQETCIAFITERKINVL